MLLIAPINESTPNSMKRIMTDRRRVPAGRTAVRLVCGLAAWIGPAFAQSSPPAGSWAERSAAAETAQPDWIAPLVTPSARLGNEIKYDQSRDRLRDGGTLDSFGGGRGADLILDPSLGITLGVPPYEQRSGARSAQGFGDWPLLRVRRRLVAANADDGDYILTAMLQVAAPTGAAAFSAGAWSLYPALAFGKGWSGFDLQGTVGAALPAGHLQEVGTAALTNLTLQYHALPPLWPEVEINHTWWADGPRGGKSQLFLTVGVALGRLPLAQGLRSTVGVGYQKAISPAYRPSPLLPAYEDGWILSTRVSF